MQDFKKLTVWEKGHRLTLAVYKATVGFPKDELYGLTSQIRRASASIPANIAEGCGRTAGGLSWVAFFKLRWARPASLNTIFFSLMTSRYWVNPSTGYWRVKS